MKADSAWWISLNFPRVCTDVFLKYINTIVHSIYIVFSNLTLE